MLRPDMTAWGDEPTEDAVGETHRIPVWSVADADEEPETFRLETGEQDQIRL